MPSSVIRLSWGSLLTSPAVMTMAWVRVPRREVLLTGLRLLLGIVPTVIMRQHIPLRVLELEHGDDDAAARVRDLVSAVGRTKDQSAAVDRYVFARSLGELF